LVANSNRNRQQAGGYIIAYQQQAAQTALKRSTLSGK
jgi:hypothetical protein